MKPQGVNRVYLVVRDFEKTLALYSKLLGATFHDAQVEDLFGVRAAISWDAGIEVISPLPGSTNPMAQGMEQYLERHGEGIYGVAFSVKDADEARDQALELGMTPIPLEFNQEQIKQHFQGRFKLFKEYILNPEGTFGDVVVAQLEPK